MLLNTPDKTAICHICLHIGSIPERGMPQYSPLAVPLRETLRRPWDKNDACTII